MNRALAHTLADYAELAYSDPTHERGNVQALLEVVSTPTGPMFVCAFAGSDDWKDWAANLRAIPVHRDELGNVADGFADCLETIWPIIWHILQDNKLPLYLTGHSQGGAMALIAAAKLLRAGMPVAGVCTFGCPAPGDDAFALALKASGVTVWQFTHSRDPVPRLLGLPHWHRPDLAYHLDSSGREITKLPGWGFLGWNKLTEAFDHRMKNYLRAVRKWAAEP